MALVEIFQQLFRFRALVGAFVLRHLSIRYRGSVLGNLPDRPQPSQKRFESLLLRELAAFDTARAVLVEGESKKIGQLQVPEALIEGMRASPCIQLDTAIEVRVIEDHYPPDDSALWARLTIGWLGQAPDVVFTSERYGEAYAHYLGCRHVLVDLERPRVPCSGTAVRAAPLGCWHYLAPCVRAHYARRVCVLGAESTGTTTLARALARRYRTKWVPEYGREYWIGKHAAGESAWSTGEFIHIAQEQARREDQMAREANRLLVLDTDAFATGIWHERYLGVWSPEVEQVAGGGRSRQLGRDLTIHHAGGAGRDRAARLGGRVGRGVDDRLTRGVERGGRPGEALGVGVLPIDRINVHRLAAVEMREPPASMRMRRAAIASHADSISPCRRAP